MRTLYSGAACPTSSRSTRARPVRARSCSTTTARIRAVAQKEFTQIFPQPGWVEHDPQEIWARRSASPSRRSAARSVAAADIAAIGITNQRETTIVWDRETGEPIAQRDRLAGPPHRRFCERLKADGAGAADSARRPACSSTRISPATKIRWLLDNVPGARARAEAGELAFGTVDTWLIWKLTGGTRARHRRQQRLAHDALQHPHAAVGRRAAASCSACRASVLPEVRVVERGLRRDRRRRSASSSVPIAGIAGDQQAALFGQMCLQPGMAKNTYGTGCFMLQNIGTSADAVAAAAADDRRVADRRPDRVRARGQRVHRRRGRAVAARRARAHPDARPRSSRSPRACPTTAASTSCRRSPGWARRTGTRTRAARSLGITRGTTAGHIARAALESIAYPGPPTCSTRWQRTAGIPLTELRVDGGAAANDLLMQFQADLLGVPVVRPAVTETTALGAAYLAGLAVGFWKSARARSPPIGASTAASSPACARAATGSTRAGAKQSNGAKGWERSTAETAESAKTRSARNSANSVCSAVIVVLPAFTRWASREAAAAKI